MTIWLKNPGYPSALLEGLADTLASFPTLGKLLNDRNNQSTKIMEFAHKTWIIKCYQRPSRTAILPRCAARPYRAFRAALHVSAARINTPSPALLAADSTHLFSVVEYIQAEELFNVLRDTVELARMRPHLLANLPVMLEHMRMARLTHGDLHPRNILVGHDGTLWLIDLDGLRKHWGGPLFSRRRAKDEHRLGKSLDVTPELRQQLGFREEGGRWSLQPNA